MYIRRHMQKTKAVESSHWPESKTVLTFTAVKRCPLLLLRSQMCFSPVYQMGVSKPSFFQRQEEISSWRVRCSRGNLTVLKYWTSSTTNSWTWLLHATRYMVTHASHDRAVNCNMCLILIIPILSSPRRCCGISRVLYISEYKHLWPHYIHICYLFHTSECCRHEVAIINIPKLAPALTELAFDSVDTKQV